jgi:hypothetical protein
MESYNYFFFSLKPCGTSDKQNESDLPSTYIYISRPGRVRKPVCQYSHIFSKRPTSDVMFRRLNGWVNDFSIEDTIKNMLLHIGLTEHHILFLFVKYQY